MRFNQFFSRSNKNLEDELCAAARCGNIYSARLLLKEGADPNTTNSNGVTAFDIAINKKQIRVLEEFIKLKIIKQQAINGINNTPLHWSIKRGHLPCLKLLLNGTETRIDNAKRTALIYAAQRGSLPCVEYLIGIGANLTTESLGLNALHWASHRNHTEIVEVLLYKGAKIDTPISSGKEIGKTALHLAARAGNLATLKILIAKGANLEARCDNIFTPLYDAAIYGNIDVVKFLVQEGAIIHLRGIVAEMKKQVAIDEQEEMFKKETIKFLVQHKEKIMKDDIDAIFTYTEIGQQKDLLLTVYKKFQKCEVLGISKSESFKELFPTVFKIIEDMAPENMIYQGVFELFTQGLITTNRPSIDSSYSDTKTTPTIKSEKKKGNEDGKFNNPLRKMRLK